METEHQELNSDINARGPRIEIITGTIRGFLREDKAGDFELVDCVTETPWVFVESVDDAGMRQCLFHTSDMFSAYKQASVWQSISGLPIYVPHTGGEN